MLIGDPARFDGGPGPRRRRARLAAPRRGDKYVTVIIDLTPVADRTGPARLLDMVEGRSKAAFADWLDARPKGWRDAIEVVAMDGFTGFKTATVEAMPDAVTVMDPFHVVRLAGDALDGCRRRLQQGPTPPTAPPKPSTAASNTSEDPPSASATSPTTSPAAYSKPAASAPDYTLDCEEPVTSRGMR